MLCLCICSSTGDVKSLTLLQSCSQQHSSLGHVLQVWLDEQSRVHERSVRPPTQCRERREDLQLLFQARADQLVPDDQVLWWKRSAGSYKILTRTLSSI